MHDDATIVTAQLVLFTDKGESFLRKGTVTSKNIRRLTPSESTKNKVISFLSAAGFLIESSSVPTLSISGKKTLFEKVFSFQVGTSNKNNVTYAIALSKPIIPTPLRPYVDDIVFSEPMEYF